VDIPFAVCSDRCWLLTVEPRIQSQAASCGIPVDGMRLEIVFP
jgi:hypothetical protein